MNQYARLLTNYRPFQTEFEHEGDHVVVLAVFDHDWEQHLLVQQCSTHTAARFLHMDRWEFALYYVCGDDIVHLHTFFDAPSAPLVEAAQMVTTWKQHGHYGGLSNAVESDSFDPPF